MEETFEDAGHRVEVSVVVEVGEGVDLVQEALLEGVDVILKHAKNASEFLSLRKLLEYIVQMIVHGVLIRKERIC